MVVVATWPDGQGRDLPRMIQLNLFHDGNDDSSAKGPAKLRWSWPFVEDTFFPGAEVVYFDAEDVQALCPGYSVRRMTSSDRNSTYLMRSIFSRCTNAQRAGAGGQRDANHGRHPDYQHRLGGRGRKHQRGVVGRRP